MKFEFLHKNNSSDLVLFFGGFGFLPSAYNLASKNDVLMVYDYLEFDLGFLEICKAYKNIKLIAFSMGVMVSSKCDLSSLNIVQKIAINGTTKGIDDEFGISEKLFKITAKRFDKESFLSRCGGVNKAFNQNPKDELLSILELAKKPCIWQDYDLAYSSNMDEIFPQNALLKSFKNICKINAPHFCFNKFLSWDEI